MYYTFTKAVKANGDVSILAFGAKQTKLVRPLSPLELRALEITVPDDCGVS